jgi:hypothetical protein
VLFGNCKRFSLFYKKTKKERLIFNRFDFFFNCYQDTLLNVFLAIAVDNLANAQEMTAQQEEAERIAKELKEKNFKNEVIIFSSPESESANNMPTNLTKLANENILKKRLITPLIYSLLAYTNYKR